MRNAGVIRRQGFSMIEVLVAMLIVMVGLLGLAGMQARAQLSEFESYQRAQALVLLYDMVDRINNNRTAASCFAVTTDTTAGTPYFGTGATATASCSSASGAATNALAVSSMNEWNSLLQGASETKSGASVGAMIGARGCVMYNAATEYLNAATGTPYTGTGEYTIAVSWQGMADSYAPTKACGAGLYGTTAASDTKRRTVWVTMRVGTLAAK